MILIMAACCVAVARAETSIDARSASIAGV
jgi:hypothetical protein